MVKKFYIIAFIIVIIDRIFKILAQSLIERIDVIPNVLYLQYAINRGVAFGLLDNLYVFITILVGIVVIGGFIWLANCPKKHILEASFILGGAAGNFIDRILYGYVIDYLGIPYFSIFNLADIMITTGVIILLVRPYYEKWIKKK